MTPSEKHDYLEGQMTGLIVAMQLLIELTPYPESSRLAIRDAIQGTVDRSKELDASASYLNGMEAMKVWITKG